LKRLLPLLAILALAAGLRLFGIGHGFPRTEYVPDTHIVRGALGMAQEKSLVPPAGRYSTYPYLLPYMLLPVYAGQYGLGRATGEWGGAEEFGQRILLEPERVHRPARILVALLGLLLPLAAYLVLIQRQSGSARADGTSPPPLGEDRERCTALFGAYLAATCLLAVHFSVQERPWGPVTAFGLLACWPAARYLRTGRLAALVATAVLGAAAAASHQAGLPMLGIAGLAWLFGPRGFRSKDDLSTRLVHGAVAVAAFALVAVAVGYNAALVHGAPEAIAGEDDLSGPAADLSLGGQSIVLDIRWASLARLSKAMIGYDPVLCLLALVGLVAAIRSRAARVPTVFALLWLAFFTTNQNDHVRYILPGLAFLSVPAAFGARILYERGALVRGVLYAVLLVPLVQSARLAWVLSNEDTRAVAARLLEQDPPTGVLAIDRYGPVLDPNRRSLERTVRWRDLGARERAQLARLEAGVLTDGPVDSISFAELFVFDERHRGWDFTVRRPPEFADVTDPNELLDKLGVDWVLVVDRDTADGRAPLPVDPGPALVVERGAGAGSPAPKLAPLRLEPQPVWEVGEPAAEQRLPTELDFPLTSLWKVTRPGPHLALYRRADR
jgi:hypothetical protein